MPLENIKKIKPLNAILAGVISLIVLMFGVLPIAEVLQHRSLGKNLFLAQTEPFPSTEFGIARDEGWKAENHKLYETGEYYQFFPGIKFDFTSRELLAGGIYFSGELLSSEARHRAREPYYKNLAETKETDLRIGQIKAGEIVIASPEAGTYVSFSEDQKYLYVFAFEHPAYVNFEYSEDTFVVPSYHKIRVRLSGSKKINEVYYSKQIKEVTLRSFSEKGKLNSFEEHLLSNELEFHPEVTVGKIIKAKEEKLEEQIQYAENYLKYWEGVGNPNWLQSIQQKFPLYPEKREVEHQLFKKMELYIKAREATTNTETKTLLTDFDDSQKEFSWGKLFMDQESEEAFEHFKTVERYNILYHWFKLNSAGGENKNTNQYLFDYWNNQDKRDHYDNAYRNLVKSEILKDSLIRSSQKEALLSTGRILSQIDGIEVLGDRDRLYALTKLRRYFSSVIYNNPELLENDKTFEAWEELAKKEIESYQKMHSSSSQYSEDFPEVLAEVIRELYSTLEYLLEKNDESFHLSPFVFNEMTQFIKDQNIEEIEEEYFDRPLFSNSEREEIELLTSFDEIRSDEDLRSFSDQIEFSFKEEEPFIDYDFEEEEEETYTGVRNIRDLSELLVYSGKQLEVEKVIFEEDGDILSFKNVYLDEEEVTGSFSVEDQEFKTFTIGSTETDDISLSDWGLYVINYKKEVEKDKPQELSSNDAAALKINQSSSLAKNRRISIQKVLVASGVNVPLGDVLVLTEDYQTFLIKGEHSKGSIKFVFKVKTKTASDFEFVRGKDLIQSRSEVNLKDIAKKIESVMN